MLLQATEVAKVEASTTKTTTVKCYCMTVEGIAATEAEEAKAAAATIAAVTTTAEE